MVILSSISVAAYKCIFHEGFMKTPEAYFFHLFYYRSRHCTDSSVNWELVGLEPRENISEILRMPSETQLTTYNYHMSLAQLIVNCLLVVTSFVAIGGKKLLTLGAHVKSLKFIKTLENLILQFFSKT